MAYNLGQPFDPADEYRQYKESQFSEEKKKLGRWAWNSLKRFGAWTWGTLKDTFGDRVSEVVSTATDLLVERGQTAAVDLIQKGPGTQEEKDKIIVAMAGEKIREVESKNGGALIPIVIAALSIGVLFGGRK
jgi:hypothetical protein